MNGLDLLGVGHVGHGGGHGGHGGHGGGGRGGWRGGGWPGVVPYAYAWGAPYDVTEDPYWDAVTVYDEPTVDVDEIADAVAERLAQKQAPAVNGLDLLGAAVAAPRATARLTRAVNDSIAAPRSVIAIPPGGGVSRRFDGNMTKVVISGGTRHERYLAADVTMYERPSTVTVYPTGGAPVTLRGLAMLLINGGNVSLNVLLGADAGDATCRDEYCRTVEAEFQTLKAAAEAAKWPADISPKIVAIDKAWQDAKRTANAQKVSVVRIVPPEHALRTDMRSLTAQLQASSGTPAPFPWKPLAIGAGLLVTLGLVADMVRVRLLP